MHVNALFVVFDWASIIIRIKWVNLAAKFGKKCSMRSTIGPICSKPDTLTLTSRVTHPRTLPGICKTPSTSGFQRRLKVWEQRTCKTCLRIATQTSTWPNHSQITNRSKSARLRSSKNTWENSPKRSPSTETALNSDTKTVSSKPATTSKRPKRASAITSRKWHGTTTPCLRFQNRTLLSTFECFYLN